MYPVEVEGVLSTHPGVAAVAVVPGPDPVMGEVGTAVVVPRDPGSPPTLEMLRDYCVGELADYKLPDAIRLVDTLPLTPMEKIDRGALREEIARSEDGGHEAAARSGAQPSERPRAGQSLSGWPGPQRARQ